LKDFTRQRQIVRARAPGVVAEHHSSDTEYITEVDCLRTGKAQCEIIRKQRSGSADVVRSKHRQIQFISHGITFVSGALSGRTAENGR
jgi:hypothetical protein